jgi:hypothetical protein
MRTRLLAGVVVPLFALMAIGQEPDHPPATEKREKRPPERPRRSGPGGEAPWRQKWEYSVLQRREIMSRADGDLQAGLSKLGEEGWELIAVRGSEGLPQRKGGEPDGPRGRSNEEFYFKRATGPAPVFGGVASFGGAGGRPGGGGGVGGGFGGGFGRAVEGRTEPQPKEPRARTASADGAAKPVFQVIALKHASAPDLSGVFRQLFINTNVRVIADGRTNSLLVSGSEEQLRAIHELLPRLDQPAPEPRK